MDDLLTAKQVQELLQVDRTTIYRMLNDGRLEGVKVGKQWRFSRSQINAILEGGTTATEDEKSTIGDSDLPIHCVQVIQDVFADVAGVGVVATQKDGEPLTNISNSCQYCNLILNSETGYQACVDTWKKLATLPPAKNIPFFTCHAGLQYAYSRINVDTKFAALLVAGQYHLEKPTPEQTRVRIDEIAQKHGISVDELSAAAREIPILDERIQNKIGHWLRKVAGTFGEIGSERAELMGRLNRIAEMTKLDI